jgi:hypothetical protein
VVLESMALDPPLSIAHTTPYNDTGDDLDSSSSSDEDADLSDAEDKNDADESISTAEDQHEDENEAESSSEDEEAGSSEDADFEVDEDVQPEAEDDDDDENNSDSSDSVKNARKPSKEKVVDEFYENPDLYGLRRSVRYTFLYLVDYANGHLVGTCSSSFSYHSKLLSHQLSPSPPH